MKIVSTKSGSGHLEEKKTLEVLSNYAYKSDGNFHDGEFSYSYYSRSNIDGYLEDRFYLKDRDKLIKLEKEVDAFLDYKRISELIQNSSIMENTDNYGVIWFNDMNEPDTLIINFRFNEYTCSYEMYDLDLVGPR
jgi:hypothetical protein